MSKRLIVLHICILVVYGMSIALANINTTFTVNFSRIILIAAFLTHLSAMISVSISLILSAKSKNIGLKETVYMMGVDVLDNVITIYIIVLFTYYLSPMLDVFHWLPNLMINNEYIWIITVLFMFSSVMSIDLPTKYLENQYKTRQRFY